MIIIADSGSTKTDWCLCDEGTILTAIQTQGINPYHQSEEIIEQVIREERLENRRRKDLNTLLRELEEIKQNIEKAAEKQHRLANLMGFYSGEFAQ